MSTRTPPPLPETSAPDERLPAGSAHGRRHAALWVVAALLVLAGCATAEPPGRRNHRRRA